MLVSSMGLMIREVEPTGVSSRLARRLPIFSAPVSPASMKQAVQWDCDEARKGGARQDSAVSCHVRRGGRSSSRRRSPFSLVACLLALWFALSARAQTIRLFEGFEGNFPEDNGWAVGDANTNGLV